MPIEYKRLTEKELNIFINMRINQLREEGAKEKIDLFPALKEYYTRHMKDGTFVSWLALDGENIVGTSGMSFIEKPPYFGCPSGKIGLLSSMFTNPDYRRKGIAKELLSRVVNDAREYGCGTVQKLRHLIWESSYILILDLYIMTILCSIKFKQICRYNTKKQHWKSGGRINMKYTGMPMGMWLIFNKSFQKNLTEVLKFDTKESRIITAAAKKKYKELIDKLPEFEKKDRFKMNIVSCAMMSAFLLSMPELPEVEAATDYYKQSMMTGFMQWFCRTGGKKKFSESDIEAKKEIAKFKAGDRNPYSWNMEFYEYEDGSGYEARFTTCGICTLMNELGLTKLIPAMCRLDYTMSEADCVSNFAREYTIASGGPYCDCGYTKRSAK